jgi:outer membrane lipopolysaccharide assembly protein LptE/RlpB
MAQSVLNSAALVAATALFAACGKSEVANTPAPKEAVAKMQEAYAGADPATKQVITSMSDAVNKGDYEQAVVSLTTLRSVPATTPEQQGAVIESARAIEANLLRAIEAGDKNAERAYQLMKEMKKN